MSHRTRAVLPLVLTLVLTLILALAVSASVRAQEEGAAAAEAAADPPDTEPPDTLEATAEEAAAAGETEATSYDTRDRFNRLLRQHPPELATILVLDPGLLSNDAFLAGYPELASFVAENPEVRHSPRFYLSDFAHRRESHGALDDVLEGFLILGVFALIALALAWLLRTIIEQKRWNRLSRTQSEVHNKILDRFGSSEELLEYVRTPAGTRFLESAPIPLHGERRGADNPPLTRLAWSIQIGVIVAAAALGMILVSFRFDAESAQALFALGAIALSIGFGFVASAAVSLFVSRRLGLWELPSRPSPSEGADASELVR